MHKKNLSIQIQSKKITNSQEHIFLHSYGTYQSLYKTNSMSICVSVCLYRRISLTAETIWFSFSMQFLIGPGKVINYYGKDKLSIKRLPPKITFLFLFKTRIKNGGGKNSSPPPPYLKCSNMPLGAYPLVLNKLGNFKYLKNLNQYVKSYDFNHNTYMIKHFCLLYVQRQYLLQH